MKTSTGEQDLVFGITPSATDETIVRLSPAVGVSTAIQIREYRNRDELTRAAQAAPCLAQEIFAEGEDGKPAWVAAYYALSEDVLAFRDAGTPIPVADWENWKEIVDWLRDRDGHPGRDNKSQGIPAQPGSDAFEEFFDQLRQLAESQHPNEGED